MNYKGSRLRDKLFLFYVRKFPNHPFKLRFVIWVEPHLFKNGLRLKSPLYAEQYLSTTDWIGRQIILHGAFEPQTLLRCEDLLKDSGVLVDIGANIGIHSLHLSKCKNVTVYAIEPSAFNFLSLLKNIVLNRSKNIYPINVALSRTDSFGYLSLPINDNPGSIQVMDEYDGINSYLIRLTTLFDIVQHLNIERIDLLKIDVEGFEMNVFEGYFDSARTVLPTNIIMEFSDMIERTGHTMQGCLDYFKNLSYEALTIEGKPYILNDPIPEHNLWFKLI